MPNTIVGVPFFLHEYDSFNNVPKQTGPFLADEEASARVTQFRYDANGNLIETIDALGNSSFQTNDKFGRPLTITDRRGNTTELEYNQLIGSSSRVTNPDGTTQEFTYDDNGRPLTQTNELGVVVQTIQYDELGRQLSVTGADGQQTTFEYNGELLSSVTVRINANDTIDNETFSSAPINTLDNALLEIDAGKFWITKDLRPNRSPDSLENGFLSGTNWKQFILQLHENTKPNTRLDRRPFKSVVQTPCTESNRRSKNGCVLNSLAVRGRCGATRNRRLAPGLGTGSTNIWHALDGPLCSRTS